MLSDFQQGWLLHRWGSPVLSRPHPHGAAIPTSYRDYLQPVWSSTDKGAGGRKLDYQLKGGCHTSGEGAAAKDLNRPLRQAHRPGTMATMGGAEAITERSVPKSPFSKPGLDRGGPGGWGLIRNKQKILVSKDREAPERPDAWQAAARESGEMATCAVG